MQTGVLLDKNDSLSFGSQRHWYFRKHRRVRRADEESDNWRGTSVSLSSTQPTHDHHFRRFSDVHALPHLLSQMYMSAGILPVYYEKEWWVLLGEERSKRSTIRVDTEQSENIRRIRLVWGMFGGKKESFDMADPWKTAYRELQEEGGGQLDRLIDKNNTLFTLWHSTSHMVVFVCKVGTMIETSQMSSSEEKTKYRWFRIQDCLQIQNLRFDIRLQLQEIVKHEPFYRHRDLSLLTAQIEQHLGIVKNLVSSEVKEVKEAKEVKETKEFPLDITRPRDDRIMPDNSP